MASTADKAVLQHSVTLCYAPQWPPVLLLSAVPASRSRGSSRRSSRPRSSPLCSEVRAWRCRRGDESNDSVEACGMTRGLRTLLRGCWMSRGPQHQRRESGGSSAGKAGRARALDRRTCGHQHPPDFLLRKHSRYGQRSPA
eukprot:scaffold7052_cov254-Pinguiococcus_pyrenoidosus.AAC.94